MFNNNKNARKKLMVSLTLILKPTLNVVHYVQTVVVQKRAIPQLQKHKDCNIFCKHLPRQGHPVFFIITVTGRKLGRLIKTSNLYLKINCTFVCISLAQIQYLIK